MPSDDEFEITITAAVQTSGYHDRASGAAAIDIACGGRLVTLSGDHAGLSALVAQLAGMLRDLADPDALIDDETEPGSKGDPMTTYDVFLLSWRGLALAIVKTRMNLMDFVRWKAENGYQ